MKKKILAKRPVSQHPQPPRPARSSRSKVRTSGIPGVLLEAVHGLSPDEAVALSELLNAKIGADHENTPAKRTLGRTRNTTLEAGDQAAQSHLHQRGLYLTLARYVFTNGGISAPPLARFGNKKLLADVVASIERGLVEGFKNSPRKITRTDRRKMNHFYCEMVGRAMQRSRKPLNVRRMLEWCSVFWSEFDRAFPDYVKSGVLWLLLTNNPLRSSEDPDDDALAEIRNHRLDREEPEKMGDPERVSGGDFVEIDEVGQEPSLVGLYQVDPLDEEGQ